jgi:hypothetical protein
MSSDEYLAKLDSLARFYNSQMIAHVGYLLTTFVLYVSAFSVALGNYGDPPLRIGLFFLGFAVYNSLAFLEAFWSRLRVMSLFTPLYHYARMRYYFVLAEAVWLHMGLKLPKSNPTYRLLRVRANKLGIENAVVSWFEARLYVSLCRSKVDPGFELNEKELELIEADKSNHQLRLFDEQYREGKMPVDEYLEKRPPRPIQVFSLEGYIRKVRRLGNSYETRFLLNRLLLMAYRHMLKAHSKKDTLIDREIAKLFQPFIDC